MHTLPDDITKADAISSATGLADPSDKIFVDGYGRQAVLRGYAVSGSTKLKETQFLPFKTIADAKASFTAMKKVAGSNVVRFQLLWEGSEPVSQGTMDKAYLDKAANQIHEATKLGLRVIVEYHQDLMARALFRKDSKYTGDGMPAWAVKGLDLTGNEGCTGVLGISTCLGGEDRWGQAQVMDSKGVRPAARAFWDDELLAGTKLGIQTAFVQHAKDALTYLKTKLVANGSWNRIVGFEPFNEPFDGGMDESSPDWDANKLWPFYNKIRTAMNEAGWQNKLEFAEPNVFWNSQLGGIKAGPLGIIKLPAALGTTANPTATAKIVFTPHFYDARRLLPDDVRTPAANVPTANGEYLSRFDLIRSAARTWGAPAFVSEFGATVGQSGHRDTSRELAGMYQAMNSGQLKRPGSSTLDFNASVLSGTQWHWDFYRNHHNELKNENPDNVQTKGDAWNGEDHSVVERDDALVIKPAVDRNLIAQAYPQAVQGGLLNFAYNSKAIDSSGKPLNWLKLCPADNDTCYFNKSKFLFEAWKGRISNAPTQTYLPREFVLATTMVITDSGIYKASALPSTPSTTGKTNEVILRDEPHTNNGGRRLMYWTDPAPTGTDADAKHFLLVVHNASTMQMTALQKIRTDLIAAVKNNRNPVLLAKEIPPLPVAETSYRIKPRYYLNNNLNEAENVCWNAHGNENETPWLARYYCDDNNANDAQHFSFSASDGKLHMTDYSSLCLTDSNPNSSHLVQLKNCQEGVAGQKWKPVAEGKVRGGVGGNKCITATLVVDEYLKAEPCKADDPKQVWDFVVDNT
ncbi:cellulase family glycosylhydrolase [Streptomyces sp. NPDC005533]|uniref:cellulase family glycosylhydrolase n=1 Tax=Streptomyces sp. NPDC005533 TaxID=3364723 RepID=UPI0036B413E1